MPAVDDLVSFGKSSLDSIDTIVAGIQRADGCTAQLSFIDHAPTIESLTDADAAVVPAWDGRVGNLGGNVDAAPSGMVASMLFNAGNTLRGFGFFSWTAVPGKRYEVQWREVGSSGATNLISTSPGAGTATTSQLDASKNYEGRVRVRNSSTWSSWVAVPNVTVLAENEVLELSNDTTMMEA
jgi:hypothetical protein